MKLKPRVLTDEDLVGACVARAEAGSSFVDSNLQAERREVTMYYQGKKPFPLREGGSRFVSQDVYESVEAMKAQITEAFAAGNNIVSFRPQNAGDVDLAQQATEYCEHVMFAQNDGLEIINGVTHDSALNRVGVAQVYWDRSSITTGHTFEDVPLEEASQLLSDSAVRLTDKPVQKDAGNGVYTVSGEFERIEDTSQVRIEVVPPEEFIVSGRFKDLARAPYVARRRRVTLGELVDDGYDPKVVYAIEGEEDDLALDEERLQREEDTVVTGLDDESEDEAGRLVTVHMSFIRIDADGEGRQQLWKVVHVGRTLLDKQKVADHPFVTYSMLPEPHTFYGGNFAARTIQHANTKTTLTRAIIEQAVEATNPRWQVARGGVANPRELIDNRRGGIVNVRSVVDSVAPLPQTPINPFVLQTIGMVDQAREDTTGISRLSQGLDKKALSHQNSAGLVEQLTSNSQVRGKVMARHFAVQFLTKLYLKVYAIGIENDRQRILEIAGNFVEIAPQQWRRRSHVQVDMTLGYDERDQQAQELLAYDKYMTQTHPRLYGEQQQYNVLRKALLAKGHKNVQDFLADPATLQPPQPDPKVAAEVAKLQKEVEVAEREIVLKEATAQHKVQLATFEAQLKAALQESDIDLRNRDADRRDDETANRIDTAQAELELAIFQAQNAPEGNSKVSAIISPNS
ncbi:portal protein [Sphingomonas desiccabilis]|uniref:Portal protein n=1 Tax=Sphingomonas desiccabilis TaxID=429134 RepID=A0A4Q2J0M9_9SPHN|nr:hypothetical protein [Sphingomonas desiccabilis]MBB3910163.1 hypothetical protein [Sphingomonas desiccabilis]RXZ34842.1 hypothetical protein EO081_04060 [Sphingomonas desiccabilis]